jgi:chromosome condensin MukBEF MukE localization factor
VRHLAALGFVDVAEDQLRLRPALLRFAEPVRGLSEPAEALAKLVAQGEVTLEGEGEGEPEGEAEEESEPVDDDGDPESKGEPVVDDDDAESKSEPVDDDDDEPDPEAR